MSDTNVAPTSGDIPAQMGSHSAMHMNTPAEKPAEQTTSEPAKEPASPGVPAMPENGSEKFYDAKTGAYNWEGHATEIEFKLSQRPEAATGVPDEEAQTAVADAGLNFDVLREKIVANGSIDESDFVALEGIGMPRDIVQEYINLATEHGARRVSDVEAAFGGDMPGVIKWSMENLTQEERDGYDVMLNSDNWKPAAATLRNQMGMPPIQSQGEMFQSPNASGPGEGLEAAFANQDELNHAIADKKYRTDPEYRAAVMRRAAKSTYSNSGNTGAHKAGL